MQKISTALLVGLVALLPAAASAVTLENTVGTVSSLINALIPLVLAIAVLVFFWGLAMYLLKTDDAEGRGKGISIMFMGIIVIFVMVSIWGIVRILQSTFRVEGNAPIIPASIDRSYR